MGWLGNLFLMLGYFVALPCIAAVIYLLGWGEGVGAEVGLYVFSTIAVVALALGGGIRYVLTPR